MPKGEAESDGGRGGQGRDYWIELRMTHQGVSAGSKHLMSEGTQSNYALRDAKRGISWSFNALPTADPERPGIVELQFNLGFALSLLPDSPESLQMQSQVRLEEGKMSLVFESPESHVELKVQPLARAPAVEKE
ncbi:MAG: hypothetical protein AAB578_08730 [Elusimicrobiota bacterium]